MIEAVFGINEREIRIEEHRRKIRCAHREILTVLKQNNNIVKARTCAHNRKSEYSTVQEEATARKKAITAYVRSTQYIFKKLVQYIKKLKDPRRLNSIKHPIGQFDVIDDYQLLFFYQIKESF